MGFNINKSIVLSALFTAFLAALLLIPHKSLATHSMGADISYECLGNNNYRLRVSFYRDCSGIPAPFAVNIDIQSVNCGIDTFAILTPIPGTGQDITPLCPSDTSTCHGGTFTGIQEWVYEGIFHFPAQCTDWNLSYSLCCRNGAITTIQSPLSENIYIFSTLNNTVTPCNNSPTFSNRPVPFVCQGQQFCFNHGAYDPDGDSLVYSVITPLSVNGNPVQYMNPYSAYQPLNSVPAMTFNSQTGDFCITPQSLEVTVMAIVVYEYRNGVLIGTVERDIQVTVISCTNILPALTGINGTNSFSATVCADAQFCFDVFSNDPDVGQNVTITWDNAIPAGTLNSNGATRPTGSFCWTPTQADASPNPHCFTATVTDDACPFLGSQIFSYCITVVDVDVDAGLDQSVNCGGLATITATATTSSGNVTYQWSNGISGPTQQVGPGTYTVTATNGQCSTTDQVTISPTAGPTAAFAAPPVCFPGSSTFTDASTVAGAGSISSWYWDFNDGTTSTQQSPAHQYPASGTYNVCLTVTSNTNCTSTICQVVNVQPTPLPSFTTSNVCVGSQTLFNNTSPVTGNSFSWDLGNGTTSTAISPTATYANSGTYNVILTATNALGCTDTVQQQVTVNPLPVANFTSLVTPCTNSQVAFTDASTPTPVSWNWNFGNGITSNLQNPSVTLPNGNSNVTLLVTSAAGCIDSIVQPVNVIPLFTAPPILPQAVCIGASVSITATGGTTYQWNGGQTTAGISVTPNTTSTYVVIVTDTNGCSDTVAATVLVNPLPTVFAGTDTSICSGTNITLTASGATSYVWSNGATSASINVAPVATTSDSETGTEANGCVNTENNQVNVNPNLTVTLSNPVMCSGATDILNAGHLGSTYLWSTGQTTQTITVSSSGIYSVTVTEPTGCTGTGQSTVTVNPLPNVSAGNNISICDGTGTQLNATGASSYLWSDGSTTQAINVAPNVSTTYSVTGTNGFGCISTSSVLVTVNPAITVTNGNFFICPGNYALLDAGNPGSNYSWSNGATTQTISVNSAGTYSVTVTAPTGCSGSGQNTVVVGAPLTNNATNASACNGINVSLDAGNPGSSYAWSNGATSQTISVGVAGNYSVVVTGVDGCTISFSSAVTIHPLPVASFNASPVCDYDSMSFVNTSSIASGSITNFQWDFNDGTNSTNQSPSHFYGLNGTYNVVLTTVSNNGCMDTTVVPVTVYASPLAIFQGTDVCLGTPTTFSENSTVINDAISSWMWSFGDGSSSPGRNQTHTYSNDGLFHVQLIATTTHGCLDTISNDVIVHPLPVANAGPDQSLCSGSTVTLGDTAQTGTTYLWSPVSGISSPGSSITQLQLTNPTITLLDVIYHVTATTQYGCVKSDDVIVHIKPLPPIYLDAPGPQCLLGNQFSFVPGGHVDANSSLSWTFGTNSTPSSSTQTFPPAVSYSAAGDHIVTLNYSYNGCPAPPIIDTINILETPPTGFVPSSFQGCAPLTVTFHNTNHSTLNQYTWTIAGDTTSGMDPMYTFDTPGSFTVTMNVQNVNGCSAAPYSLPVTVSGNPTAAFSYTPQKALLHESLVHVENNSIGASQYQWDFGDGASTTFFDGDHMYSDTGTFEIMLIVISQNGCRDTAEGVVIVEEGFSFYVPNAFTPNGDGDNDYFQGYGTFLKDYEMWIYDRWGLVIYHTNDYDLPWDGRINTMAQNDTYVYRIVVKDRRERDHVYIGHVSLVK